MGNSIRRRVARFEDFEVHLETGEVWKAGRSLKIQDQPFKVLAALLERPGEIVTREELRQRIYPTWSPDGRQIAFVRFQSDDQKSLYVIPAFGGSERHVYTASFPKWSAPSTNGEPRYCNKMDWSPDGNSLIFSESVDKGTKARLTLLSLSDLTARPLTSPRNHESDCSPVFSPDGATVAFARSLLSGFLSDVFIMQVAGGQPLRLTTGNSGGDAAWTQDGSEIVFASPAKGFWSLWRMSASGGMPQRVAGPGDAYEPSISRRGNQLAYQVWKRSDTIWRLDLKDERHALAAPLRLLSGRDSLGGPAILPTARRSSSNQTAWAIAIFGCATAMGPIVLS